MPFRMNLWQVDGNKLHEVRKGRLDNEARLEEWIAGDPGILGLDLLIIGRQVNTDFGGRIDLLGLDADGNLFILELKRHKTPREIVAQTLDYASWVKDLTYQQIVAIAYTYLKHPLSVEFSDRFDTTLPETLNGNHSMVIVTSELDDASERIVQYLATEHGVGINVIFFNFYQMDSRELVGRAWLMDPLELEERSQSRKQAPWSGYYFVNVGDGDHRKWEDNVKYNYIGAGQRPKFSQALQRLRPGDKIFAYLKGLGYVGYGEVVDEAVPIAEFTVEEDGRTLLDHHLQAPLAGEHKDDLALSEWAVRVKWIRVFPREQARTFKGIFANQNVVCKLRHPETVQFVERAFAIQ